MIEKGEVEPDRSLDQDPSYGRAYEAGASGVLGSNQRPKDPWRAFFELLDEPDGPDEPKV